ncbi:hypothetical protein C6Y45_13780 [Alkalicoccus saliphilus]|uniref:Uncharacterized protein n=1 Tax=Alkalicoccus saliphilus TaxID=200989 RepID=A0A2T4U3F2_9BACI|nr:hypothetical protein C6Y45_13780 [Alkalicoccus saliphilus]
MQNHCTRRNENVLVQIERAFNKFLHSKDAYYEYVSGYKKIDKFVHEECLKNLLNTLIPFNGK